MPLKVFKKYQNNSFNEFYIFFIILSKLSKDLKEDENDRVMFPPLKINTEERCFLSIFFDKNHSEE